MIPKLHRFHGSAGIRQTFAKGKVVRGNKISIKYAAKTGNKPYRIAVVVSTKVSKSAVVRNRIRRRIYEITRGCTDDITGSYDVVVTVFDEDLSTMPFSLLEQNIKKLFYQAGIIKNQ